MLWPAGEGPVVIFRVRVCWDGSCLQSSLYSWSGRCILSNVGLPESTWNKFCFQERKKYEADTVKMEKIKVATYRENSVSKNVHYNYKQPWKVVQHGYIINKLIYHPCQQFSCSSRVLWYRPFSMEVKICIIFINLWILNMLGTGVGLFCTYKNIVAFQFS